MLCTIKVKSNTIELACTLLILSRLTPCKKMIILKKRRGPNYDISLDKHPLSNVRTSAPYLPTSFYKLLIS